MEKLTLSRALLMLGIVLIIGILLKYYDVPHYGVPSIFR